MAKSKKNSPVPSEPTISPEAKIKEEISFLRQTFNSLVMRGHYKECFKLIEENLKLLYFKDRWPENFFTTLRLHKRCYPSMELEPAYEDYLCALLRKAGIPWVFSLLLKGSDTAVVWSGDYFKDLAIISEGRGELDEALSYCNLMIKMEPANSNAYLLKGWIWDDMNRPEEATEEFLQALAVSDKNYQAHHALAKLYVKTDKDKALCHIEQALELLPNDAAFHATKARILQKTGNKQGAIAAYEEANTLDPRNPEYPYEKAELLLTEKQTIAAIRQYGKAVALDEKHLPSLKRLAVLLREAQPESALSYINTVTTLEPENVDAALLKAHLHRHLGDDSGAIRQYKRVLELDDRLAAAYGALGYLRLPLDEKKALQAFESAVELEPQNASFHFGKAQALQKSGRTEDAIQEYKQTISLDKENAKAYAELGYLHTQSRPKEAVEYFDRAIALMPENPYYYAAKGEALLLMPHKPAEALESFNQAVLHDPGNAQLQLRLAMLLEQENNLASAVEHYRFAVSLNQTLKDGYYGLARLLCESEPESALPYINSAISLDANNGDYYYIKAQILSQLGLRLEALEQLKKSMYVLPGQNAEVLEELSQMLSGDSLRVALMYINRAIELKPNNSAFICSRANLLYAAGQKSMAFNQYALSSKFDPQNHQALFGAGRILSERKDKKALEYLNKAIALAPDIAAYPACKAAFLARSHETLEQALACYDAAIMLDMQHWPVILEKAELLFKNGDFLSAQESFRRVLLINQDCAQANMRMCILLADQNPQAALRYITHALELEPQIPSHYVWKGRLLQTLGDEDGAEQAFREAINLGEGSAEVYFMLAQALHQKLPETGLKYAYCAAELKPEMTEAHLLCGNIHFMLHEPQEAEECFAKALELSGRCHPALAGLARLRFEKQPDSPEGPELINRALAVDNGNTEYLCLLACMLEAQQPPQLDEALEAISLAVKNAPEQLAYREKLVELLQQKRSFMRLPLEKSTLKRLRHKQAQRLEALRLLEMQPAPVAKPPA